MNFEPFRELVDHFLVALCLFCRDEGMDAVHFRPAERHELAYCVQFHSAGS